MALMFLEMTLTNKCIIAFVIRLLGRIVSCYNL